MCLLLCVVARAQQPELQLDTSDINSGSDRFVAFSGTSAVYRISQDSSAHLLSLKIAGKWSTTQGSTGPTVSPDQRWIAFTRNQDLWLCNTNSGHCSQVTSLGQPK